MSDFLIIRLSSLGDIVMTTAVIEKISNELPDAHIHFLTKNEYEGVFHEDKRIKRFIGIKGDEPPHQIIRMTGEYFDAVIDLHGNLRSRAVSMLIRSPKKARLNKHPITRRLMVWSKNRFQRDFDVIESYLHTLDVLGLGGVEFPKMTPSDTIVRTAAALLNAYAPESEISAIGIAPGAKHPSKRWNEDSFAHLADEIFQNGNLPVFIGDNKDAKVIRRIQKTMSGESLSLAGKIDLTVTIGLIALLNGLVTNDSGPMHIAGALGTPFVSIFGPTHPSLGFVPGYPNGMVLHTGVPCSPCSIHGEKPCWMENRCCMDGITWEMVYEELELLLAGKLLKEAKGS